MVIKIIYPNHHHGYDYENEASANLWNIYEGSNFNILKGHCIALSL